ncbi:MAG: hypothetical protein Q8N23_34445 [Archangium sp.]|nr:hypothetical protein [Archangium sp.]MDP3157822.1 hypothetical protein [Archangium sp.]MDP3576349.1 hypothetical protein [Archangium sp.]
MSRSLFVVVGCVALLACPGAQVDCRVGADCASGVCLRDGTCGPVSDSGVGGGTGEDGGLGGGAGGGSGTGGGSSTGGGTGGGGSVDGGTGGGGMSAGCLPNNDGVIERDEVFFQPGLRATFKISGPASFNTAGTAAADGGREWDFTAALAGDTSRLVETRALTGEWYESNFPDAGYVTELGQGSTLLGVFSATNDALYLQGVVSPTDSSTGTELHYAPWVKVLQFPLQSGISWGTDSSVSGKYQGYTIGLTLPLQREVYTSSVDRSGEALTPYANTRFQTLRVRTVMDRYFRANTFAQWFLTTTIRSFNWNAECFGTVATLTSTNNESSTEFTDAGEVRRLSN